MNVGLLTHEIAVAGLGVLLLLADLWLPASCRRALGWSAAAGLGLLLVLSVIGVFGLAATGSALGGMFVQDEFSLFFKRLFLLIGIFVLLMAVEFSDRFSAGLSEYYVLMVFTLTGMMLAASANDLLLLFVSIELMTVSLYILTAYQRTRRGSVEAGVKYLILGALSSAFLVMGIALIWGLTGRLNFTELGMVLARFSENPLFLSGVVLVLGALGFKLAAVPFQVWAPDVYEGSPTPTTALLAAGSKAAGVAMLLRLLFTGLPGLLESAALLTLLMVVSGASILYGNLGALGQQNLKRLLGYSGIAHAGYVLLGVVACNAAGQTAVLFYIVAYALTVLGAFVVIGWVLRHLPTEHISGLAGLHQRSPLLAATVTLSMVSLAGIPPLAGFFGKFLLIRSLLEQLHAHPGYGVLAGVGILGVVISIYYYFRVIRAVYWEAPQMGASEVALPQSLRFAAAFSLVGMLYLGLFPGRLLHWAEQAARVLAF
ncbi:MAG: NADH-quinone oxidoreductase subunit N [Verrucomicrobiota bacterium]|nr:NADH-quinone oxidoreductase subunit N [Limisphaera sp.]MDW8381970.1 NADH-quinone oxidoreductase subunit N [Verrucomicrobiota bacterium]